MGTRWRRCSPVKVSTTRWPRKEVEHVMTALFALVATVINTVLIAAVVRRLLGVAVGWPRTLLLSAMATTAASPPLERIFEWIGLGSVRAAAAEPVAATLVGLLFGAWLLAVQVSVLAVAEAVVPTGSVPGPVGVIRELPGALRRARRYLGILGIAARHGLLRYLGRSPRAEAGATGTRRDTATSVREALIDGGVTFIKLGQMLATRPDVLPPRYIEELSHLHSQVPPEAWGVVARTITEELGAAPEEAFASIDPEPLAAASVGQVHTATLPTGEPVVVKVQRSTASHDVRGDLDIITRLAAMTERRTGWARRMGTTELAAGFRRSLDEELDFRVELHNLATLRRTETVIIPRARPEFSTRRVLTMQHLDGVPLSRAREEIAALPATRRHELASALLDLVLQQIFVDGIFHADLHGGNILLLADGRLALLDLGAVGRMDRGGRSALTALVLAVNRQDGAAAAKRLTRLMEAPAELDTRMLERRLADLVMRVGSLPLEETLGELFDIAMDHGLRVSPAVAAAFRSIGALEGTLHLLSPDVDVLALARERAGVVADATLDPDGLLEEVKQQAVATIPLVQRVPEQLATILQRLDRPHHGLRLALVPDVEGERFLAGLVQQIVQAILAAICAASGTALVLSEIGPLLAPQLRLVTYAGLVVLLFAYVLGSRLVVTAFRGRYETATARDG